MGRAGMAFSTIAVVVGAILYWAVTTQGTGFRVSTVGVILMVAGGAGFVTSAIVYGLSRRPAGSRHHSYDRQVVDPQGRSSEVHEEVH
jgi:phosphate/sulfate permease